MMDDEELMSDLRRLCERVDPVPELVVDHARDALLTRRFDEEFAELLLDTAVESGQVRGDEDGPRLLSFRSADLSLEIRVESLGELMSVHGFVEGTTDEIEANVGDERRALPLDADGRFTMEVQRGATRFRLRADNGVVVTTRWVLL